MNKNTNSIDYIDSNHYLDDPNKDMSQIARSYKQIDPVRANSNLLWTIKDEQIVKYTDSGVSPKVFLENLNDLVYIKANKSSFTKEFIDNDGLKRVEFDVEAWEQYINNVLNSSFSSVYEDFYFKLPSLNIIKELSGIPSPNMVYANREFVYNFYSPLYENIISNPLSNINTFPSFLNVFNDPKIDSRTYEENLKLSLGGIIPEYLIDSLVLSKEFSDNVLKYFETYSELRNSDNSNTALAEINKQSNNIFIDNKKINDLNSFSYVPFPYYADIRFTNLSKEPNKFIHSINNIGEVKKDLNDYFINNNKKFIPKPFIVNNKTPEANSLKSYNLKNWILSGLENTNYNSVEYTKLLKYMVENIKPLKREYNNLLNTASHSEVILYKLEKRQTANITSDPIQAFWISPNDKSSLRYIDTQLKYATDYYYTVIAYVMVIGNEYSYTKYDYSSKEYENDILNGIYKVKLSNKASYKVFEVPMITLNGAIYEAPLTKPKLNISKKDSNIKISLDNSEIESLEKITILENKEYRDLQKIIASQENEEEDKIYCRNILGIPKKLQIYKMAQMPQDFLSFQGKLYKTLNIEEGNSFEDSILSGIKYYYTFRYLNNHNIPSNISDIYEIELKDEEGYTYLNVKNFDIHRRLEKKLSKGFKKYLLIRPSIIQTQIEPYEQDANINDVKVGPNIEPVWQKDFVIRITSKQSNRILEFNLKSIINK